MNLFMNILLTCLIVYGVGVVVLVIIAVRSPGFHGWAKLSEDAPDGPA